MNLLLITTAIWAFSFSLIGVYLAGSVDPYFSAFIRIALATALFLPFLFKQKTSARHAFTLMFIGAIQLGCMYVFYYQSFERLSVPEVLVFTIFTPIYVTLLNDLSQKKFSPHYLLTATIAVAGTAIIRWGSISESFIIGCIFVQITNICFAFGQIAYKHTALSYPNLSNHQTFGYFYIGAFIISLLSWIILGGEKKPISPLQWSVLIWLGLVASGLGYFLWNQGAKKVNTGALAIMNNALVPAGLLVNLLIWNRDVNLTRLIIGTAIILLSLFTNERFRSKTA